jgi:ribonuclease HII
MAKRPVSTEQSVPDFAHEARLRARGFELVAGVDEVGRGPLAGPVVAAAVILDPEHLPDGLNDSKKLTASVRERLFTEIMRHAHVAIASIPAARIDAINIRQSTFEAMAGAVNGLAVRADFALIDGRDIPPLPCPAEALIGGDRRSLSIAAASIIAKVTRDRMMTLLAQTYPDYGFEKHMGYGTVKHLEALDLHGPTPLHRMSFAPLKHAETTTG